MDERKPLQPLRSLTSAAEAGALTWSVRDAEAPHYPPVLVGYVNCGTGLTNPSSVGLLRPDENGGDRHRRSLAVDRKDNPIGSYALAIAPLPLGAFQCFDVTGKGIFFQLVDGTLDACLP